MLKRCEQKLPILLVAILALSFLFFSQSTACQTITAPENGPFCSAQQLLPTMPGNTQALPDVLLPAGIAIVTTLLFLFAQIGQPRATQSVDPRVRLRQRWLEPALRRLNGIQSNIFLPTLFATHDF